MEEVEDGKRQADLRSNRIVWKLWEHHAGVVFGLIIGERNEGRNWVAGGVHLITMVMEYAIVSIS